MPAVIDHTYLLKDTLFALLNGTIQVAVGDEDPITVPMFDSAAEGDRFYLSFGPFIPEEDRLGTLVTAQVDAWSARDDSRQVDLLKAEVIRLVTGLEGTYLDPDGGGASEPVAFVTRCRLLPSPTLDERGLASDVNWHAACRFEILLHTLAVT